MGHLVETILSPPVAANLKEYDSFYRDFNWIQEAYDKERLKAASF